MKGTVYCIVMILLFSLLSGNLSSYGGKNIIDEVAKGVTIDRDGNIIVVEEYSSGNKYILRVEKYDAEGNLIWQKDFDEFTINLAAAVATDKQGNIYVGGTVGTQVGKIFPLTDYLILKYDGEGNMIWHKTYNKGILDSLLDIAIDDDGYVYATGMVFHLDVSEENITDMDFWTIKVDTDGNLVKEDVYGEGMGGAFGIDVSQEDVVVAGVKDVEKGIGYLIKYDRDLNRQWIIYYNNSCFSDASIMPDKRIVVTGMELSERYDRDGLTILYDENGEILPGWPIKEKSPYDEYFYTIAVDSENNIIVAGYKQEGFPKNWYIVKYDSNGNKLWEKIDVEGEIERIVVGENNTIIVAGYKYEGDDKISCVRKYDADGSLLWEAKRAIIKVSEISGGLGISMTIKNSGVVDAYNVRWSINVEGFLIGRQAEGVISYIPVNKEVEVKMIAFGFGAGKIVATAGSDTVTKDCFIIGPFVIMKE